MQNYYHKQARSLDYCVANAPMVRINHKLNKSKSITKEGRMAENIEKKRAEFTPELFRQYKTSIDDAIARLNHDKSKDDPATDYTKDDDWNAIDTLNVYFNSIEEVISSSYVDEGRKKAQSILKKSLGELVETAKLKAPHLTEKYDKVLRPRLYDIKVLTDVVTTLENAQAKLRGNTSLDIPPTSIFKDDGFDPLDSLTLAFDTVNDVLNTTYVSPECTQFQSKIVMDCCNILKITEIREGRPIFMSASYQNVVNTMKTKYGFKLEEDKRGPENEKGSFPF